MLVMGKYFSVLIGLPHFNYEIQLKEGIVGKTLFLI